MWTPRATKQHQTCNRCGSIDQLMQPVVDEVVALEQEGADVATDDMPAHVFEGSQGAIQEGPAFGAKEGGRDAVTGPHMAGVEGGKADR